MTFAEKKEAFLQSLRVHPLYMFLEKKKTYVFFFLLAVIAWFGYYIRTRNLPLLTDVTTGGYIPADPDAIGILRYVQYVVEHGQLMTIDYMRYYPNGFTSLEEFALLSHLIAWFYKIFHFFVPTVTVVYAHVLYPAVAFVLALVFFFLFVQKLFDWKLALVAAAFLAVVQPFLERTISGVADKEALAMIFFFLTLYLFMCFILEKQALKSFFFILGAALAGGCLWLLWGGFVFVFLSIAGFLFLLVCFERLSFQKLWMSTLFFVVPLLMIRVFYPARYNFFGLVMTPAIGLLFFSLVLGFVQYFLFTKDLFRLRRKYSSVPSFLFSFLFVLFFGGVWFLVYYGPTVFFERIAYTFFDFVNPFSATRWSLTVSENFQPYFTDFLYAFGWQYFLATLLGSLLLFYETFKSLGKKVFVLLGFYFFMLLAIFFSRYAGGSVLNGETFFSRAFYVSGFILFLGYFLFLLVFLYRKDKEKYLTFTRSVSLSSLFVLVLFFFLLLGAHSADRLLFVYAPVTAILLAYFIFSFVRSFQEIEKKDYRYYLGALLVVVFLVVLLFLSSSRQALAVAESFGSIFNPQWQYAMQWVRENTGEDAVFAQWWDYGYYIQTFGERATLSDGGNAESSINYFMGRYLFTAANDTEVLAFLAARNVTHVLVPSQSIGIYTPISLIGSDAEFDRLSWLRVFTLDTTAVQELRNGTKLVYTGIFLLDEDLILGEQVYPRYSMTFSRISIPIITNSTGAVVSVEQPSIHMDSSGGGRDLSVGCVFYAHQKVIFEDADLDSCIFILPKLQDGQVRFAEVVLYLSPLVVDDWFVRYYLFEETSPFFEKVYSDQDKVPVMFYNGLVIGPIHIWEVHYPKNLTIPEEFYTGVVPEGVTEVGFFEKLLL